MSLAFRRDTEDPEIVKEFSAFIGSEERLKMLTLMTLVDVEAVSPETLTSWKEELLWRPTYTYNGLTQRYGDEVIERNQSGLNELLKQRPDDLSVTEITRFLEGLPQRYLQLFARDVIHRHVRLVRDIHPDEVHLSLERGQASVCLPARSTSHSCSRTSAACLRLGMNIIRGHALTNPNGLVLDVFQFTDDERFLELNMGSSRCSRCLSRSSPSCRRRRAAAADRTGCAAGQGRSAVPAGGPRRQPGPPAATRSSTSWRRTRSACSIESAA